MKHIEQQLQSYCEDMEYLLFVGVPAGSKKNQEPGTRNQEPGFKNQEPRAKSQRPKAKSQKPTANG